MPTSHKTIIGVILLLLALCSLKPLGYGLPFHLVGDEETLISGALTMAKLKTIFPVFHGTNFSFLYYPILLPLLYLGIIAPLSGILFFFSEGNSLMAEALFHLDILWIGTRSLSLVAGLFLCGAVYRFVQRACNDTHAALIATISTATSFLHFQLSLFARHWIFGTLLCTLALAATVSLPGTRHKTRTALFIGICLALSFGIGTIGFATALFVFLFFLFVHRTEPRWGIVTKEFAFIVSSAALGLLFFFGTHPGAFLFILAGAETPAAPKTLHFILNELATSGTYLLHHELTLCILALGGSFALWKQNKKHLVLICWTLIIAYNFILLFFFHNAARYHVFTIPLLSLLAGAGISFLSHHTAVARLSPYLRSALMGIVFLIPTVGIVRYASLLSRPTTEQYAATWVASQQDTTVFLIHSSSLDFFQADSYVSLQETYGRARAWNRALVGIDSTPFGKKKIHYLNIHFFDTTSRKPKMLAHIAQSISPRYYITAQHVPIPEPIADMIDRHTPPIIFPPTTFHTTPSETTAFSDFGIANHALFSLDRFGETIIIYPLIRAT